MLHTYYASIACSVALSETHRSSVLIRVACSINLSGGKWSRAWMWVGIIVSGHASVDRIGTALEFCNSWLMGADHPNYARSG